MTDSGDATRPGAPALVFEEVFRTQFAYVWGALRRLGVRDKDLEDLTHDVFIIVHRKQDHYDPSRPLKPWLFGIAANCASDYRRRAGHRLEQVRDDADGVEPGEAADARLERREREALVHRALQSVDPSRLPVFVMHELDGVSMPEIVEALSIPLNTGYSRLRLARAEFTDAVRRLRARGGGP